MDIVYVPHTCLFSLHYITGRFVPIQTQPAILWCPCEHCRWKTKLLHPFLLLLAAETRTYLLGKYLLLFSKDAAPSRVCLV